MNWEPLLLAGSLVGGYLGSRALPAHGRADRLALCLVLGAAFFTAWWCLLSRLLPPTQAKIVALALSCIHWPGSRDEAPRAGSSGVSWGSWPVLLLGAVAAWLAAVGGQQLYPALDSVLWQLPNAGGGDGPVGFSSLFGGQAWSVGLWAMGGFQLLSAVGLFLFARLYLGSSQLVVVVAFLSLLASTPKGFLLLGAPDEALLHLWTAAYLLLFLSGRSSRASAVVLALAALMLNQPLGQAMLVACLPHGKGLTSALLLAGAGVSCYLKGVEVGWLVALGLALYQYRQGKPEASPWLRGLVLLELWGPGWGVFALCGLYVLLARRLEKAWPNVSTEGLLKRADRELLLSGKAVVVPAACLLLIASVLPGEKAFNDQILLTAQKERVSLTRLLWPHSLSDWLAWRGARFDHGTPERRAVELLSAGGADGLELSAPLGATFVEHSRTLPSSSLIPLQVRLRNPSLEPYRNEGVIGARFEVNYRSGEPAKPLEQPVTQVVLPQLPASGETTVTVWLRTERAPTAFELKLWLVGSQGEEVATAVRGDAFFRTWSAAPPHAMPEQKVEKS